MFVVQAVRQWPPVDDLRRSMSTALQTRNLDFLALRIENDLVVRPDPDLFAMVSGRLSVLTDLSVLNGDCQRPYWRAD